MKTGSLTGMYYDVALAAPLMAGLQPGGETGENSGADAGGSEADGPAVLILGNGTGTYATQCDKYFGRAARPLRIEGVEIDQKITDLAEEYFAMPEDIDV